MDSSKGARQVKNILQQAIQLQPEMRHDFLREHNINIYQLLHVIGSPDSELRDELAFRIFVESLYANSWPKKDLKEVVEKLISNDYLFFKIGEVGKDSIYTRSFSALWLSYLLKVDAQQPFLNEQESKAVFDKLATYLMREYDTRGLVENEGWANAVTHAGDMFIACVLHPHFEIRFVPQFLQGISKCIWAGHVFVDDEEQRLAELIKLLHSIDYPEEILIEWMEQLFDKLDFHLDERGYTRDYFKAKTNSIHLMQAIYFKLKFAQVYPKAQSVTSFFIAKSM